MQREMQTSRSPAHGRPAEAVVAHVDPRQGAVTAILPHDLSGFRAWAA